MPNEIDQQTTLPPEDKPLSLREELAANLTAAIQPEEKEPTEAPPPNETAEQKAGRLANRERDASGKLLPGTKPPVEETQQAQEPKPPRPSSWKKDHWQDWERIAAENPKLAAYLNQREHEFASGVSTYKQEWEQAKPLIDAIAPFQPILQQHGIQPAQWISNLGNAHHKLVVGSPQDKVAMLQTLVREYGIPVHLAVQGQDGNYQLLGQQPAPQQPQFDPSIIPRLVQQELQAANTKQTLEQFTRDAPTKYPHFEAVKQTMAGLLQAGLATDLPSAYEAALRHPSHSDLFDAMQQQQREQREAEEREKQKLKVVRARSNAVSTPSATPGGIEKATGEKGLRETIAENLRAVAGGRV